MLTNKQTIIEHNERLSALVEMVENLPDAPEPVLQDKEVTPTTELQEVTVKYPVYDGG